MLDKIHKLWYNFKYEHDDLISTLLFLSVAVGIILLILFIGNFVIWLVHEPFCNQFSKSFLGEYRNDFLSGCFVKLSDGNFYYYKNILITP